MGQRSTTRCRNSCFGKNLLCRVSPFAGEQIVHITARAIASIPSSWEEMDRRNCPIKSTAVTGDITGKRREWGIQCNSDSCGTDRHSS